jgi:tocopherol O-methyltransferase
VSTPKWLEEQIRKYYAATTEKSYLANWATSALGFHLGLSDEGTLSHEESIKNTNAYLADRARISPGCRVLDAGCGVGGSSLWLAEERGACPVGITISPEQLDLARRFARQRGLEGRVEFHCMDMVSTTFPADSFDVIWNVESMCHVLDLRAYFEHVLFLLRDGGRFACIDLLRTGTARSEQEKTACEGWAMAPLRNAGEVVVALHEAGFYSIESEDLSQRALKSVQALHAAAHNSQLLIRAEKAMGSEVSVAYEKHVLAATAWAEGFMNGTLTVAYFGAVRMGRPSAIER